MHVCHAVCVKRPDPGMVLFDWKHSGEYPMLFGSFPRVIFPVNRPLLPGHPSGAKMVKTDTKIYHMESWGPPCVQFEFCLRS